MTATPARKGRKIRSRDAAATRQGILVAAIGEFCDKGYDGAGTEQIAQRADTNIRMLYHYFGSKEKLYQACLEKVYEDLRAREAAIDLTDLLPEKAIEVLLDFTFDHLQEHPEFIRLVGIENINQGKMLRNLPSVPERGISLLDKIRAVLDKGARSGILRAGVDPFQFYVSLLSLSYLHLSNKYTLSITFNHDLEDPHWLAERREHVREVLLSYLRKR